MSCSSFSNVALDFPEKTLESSRMLPSMMMSRSPSCVETSGICAFFKSVTVMEDHYLVVNFELNSEHTILESGLPT
jgi:hypothetical protein